MAIYELDGMIPRVADTAWVADNAQVIGDGQPSAPPEVKTQAVAAIVR